MQAEVTDYDLAVSLRDAENAGSVDDVIDAENAIIARLNLPLDSTEQGLTKEAADALTAFCRAAGVL